MEADSESELDAGEQQGVKIGHHGLMATGPVRNSTLPVPAAG